MGYNCPLCKANISQWVIRCHLGKDGYDLIRKMTNKLEKIGKKIGMCNFNSMFKHTDYCYAAVIDGKLIIDNDRHRFHYDGDDGVGDSEDESSEDLEDLEDLDLEDLEDVEDSDLRPFEQRIRPGSMYDID